MIIGNPLLLKKAADSTPDPVTRSLRLDGSTSKLTRTPSSASSATACTISFWVKRGKTDEENTVFHAGTASGDRGHVRFNSNNTLEAACYNGSWFVELKTNAVYRDPSAFYHIFVSIDTTNGTGKLFVNGEEPSLQTNTTNSSSTVLPFGKTIEHQIGQRGFDSTGYHDGLLADFYFIDGTALSTPVGNLIEDTGYSSYKPLAFDMSSYSGNSFHLKFEDSSDIGADSTSNSNDFSVTNLSSHDVMLDTPTKNYATLNPLDHSGVDFSEGNLAGDLATVNEAVKSTMAVSSGKWYWEVVSNNSTTEDMIGIAKVGTAASGYFGSHSGSYGYYKSNGYKYNNASYSSYGATYASGDIIGVALDLDNGTLTFYKNNSSQGTAFTGLSGEFFAGLSAGGNSGSQLINFGQDPTFAGNKTSGQDTSQSEFYYAPPTGFKSLNTSNLDAPTVTPAENFNSLVYQGASPSDKSVTGVGFQPDLVWIKARTQTYNHAVYDSVRGATKELHTNTTDSEDTDSNGLKTFDSDGFTVGSDGEVGDPTGTRISWNWKAHQTPTSTRTTYTVKVEDASGDAWDASSSFYDSSTYLPSVYMELWENRSSGLVSLGKVAVRSLDEAGNSTSDTSEQTYELKCVDLNAITVKWHYDTSGDGDSSDFPNSYNDLLNEQKITILDGSTSEWTTNNHSNDDGGTDYNYSPPSGWANGDSLKSATTSYTGSDTATLTSGAGPVEKYNAAAGFSIITYSGNGSSAGDTQEITHTLGDEPEFIITKSRGSSSSDGAWNVYHKDAVLGTNYNNETHPLLWLNRTWESYDPVYSPALPKSGSENTTIIVNNDSSYGHYANEAGITYVMYAWAGVEGYSKFGKYTGNASADGPFIYTGFRPAFVLIKPSSTSGSWLLFDSARDSSNSMNNTLYPHNYNAESGSGEIIDFYSSGFKIRGNYTDINSNADAKIYAAFAESPFKHANAK